jgi:tape measure domain-containing protein
VANTLATLKVLIQAQAQGVEQALGRTQEAIKSFMSGMQATSRAAASAQRSAQAMESFSQATQRAGAAARTAAPQIQSLSSSLQQVHKTAATVAEEMVDLGGIFSTMSTRIGRVMLITLEFGVALKALQAAGAVFGTWRESVFGLNASLELLQIRLTTLYGSVEKANQVLSFLITLAAKSPYGIQDLAKALNYLAAAGAPAEALPRILTAIVNITAAFGGSADVFERVSLALFQMAQRGKVVGEEMRQLTNAGIPAWQVLAETIGVSIAQAMDMVEKRQVDAQTFIEGLVAWSEGRLGDMSDAIMRTWTGAIQAVQEGVQFFLAQGFQPLFQAFRDALVEIGNFVSSDALLVEWAARVNGAVQVVVAGLYGFVGVLRDVLYEAASFALSLGQAIYEALQWINPFARHSPSLVEDVEGGIDQIVDAFGDLEDIQGHVDAIRRQIRLLQIELRTMQIQLRDVEAQLRRERKILDEYRENLRRVTDRIREIESAIRDLARVQLAEELPYLDQLKQYDREIKRLRLQKLRLEFSGVPAAFIDELATKIEILSKRAEMVDLERELNVGPLKEQLEAAADAALGLNQAMSFGEALSRISELTAELVNLRTEQEYWQNLVEQQEAVVAALEEQADALRNAMDELRNAIDQLRNQLAEFQNESARSRDELEKLKVPAIGVAGAFSILHRAIQDVATTPFVVDTSGLDSLAKRSADAEEVLRRATAVMESILPGAASKSAMEVREFARQIAAASAGTDDFKDAVKDYGSALDDARAALQEQQSVLREYERLLRDVESAIRDTERAIRDLTEVPLAEEQPYIEQLKELEKQIKQLELRKVELILAGAPEEQIKGVENEIRRLEAQAKKVDLERELKVEPLREQLRKMADEALDTGKVLTFAEAQQAMIAHIENLKKLREEHTRIAEATERQRDLVEEWSKKVEALAAGYDALRESIQKVGKEAQEPAMGATTQWSFADPSVFQQAEEQRKRFEKIASETRQRIEEVLKPLAPFLTEAAGFVSRFVVTATALGTAFIGVRVALLPFFALLQNFNIALAPAIAYSAGLASVLSGQLVSGLTALIVPIAAVARGFLGVVGAVASFLTFGPAFQRAAGGLIGTIEAIRTVVGALAAGNWLAVLGAIVGWLTRLGGAAQGVASVFVSLTGVFLSFLNPIKALSVGLGALQLGFSLLKAPMLIVTGLFQGLFGGFWGLVNLVTLVWQAFSKNWFGIRDIFVPVAQQILEGLQTIQQAFSEQGLAGGIRTLFDVGGNILQSLGGAFLQLGQNIMTAIQQVDWGAVGKTISDGLSGLGTALVELGTRLWEKLAEIDWSAVASKAIDLLISALTAIAAPVDRLLTWLVNLFVSIDWGQVAQQAQDALLAAWSALTIGLDRLYQWLVDTFSRIDWGEVARTIGDLLVAVLSTEVKLIGAVLSWFASIDWQQVAQDAATALATAWSVVTGVAERIAEWFGKLFDQVNWGEVAQTAGDALASAWGALTGGAEHLFNWLKNLIGGIDWGGLADEARRRLGEALGELRSAVVAGALDPEKSLGPLQKPLETLFRVFEENRGTIETAIGFIKDMLAPAFDSIKQAITDTVGVIRDQLGPTWQQIKEAFSAVIPVLGVIAGVVGGALLVAFRLLAEAVQALLPLIVNLFFEGIQSGLSIIEGAANVIMGFVNIVVGLFTGDWQRAFDGAKQILNGFKEAALGVLDSLLSGFGAIFGKIWDVIKGFFQGWLSAQAIFWQAILGAVTSALTAIKDVVVGKVAELVTKGKDLVSDLRIALEERWNAILTKVQEIWEGIKTFVSEKVTGLKETALNVITEARDRLAGLWDEIKQKATTIWDELKRHFENAKQALLDALKWPFEQLRDTAARIWDEVWNKATTIWDQLKRFFENLKQGMYDALEWPFKAFRDNIESILGAAYNFAIAPINALIDAFNAVERAIAAALRWIGEKLGIDFLRNIHWTDIPRIPGYSGGGGYGGGGVRAYAEGTDYHPGGLALVGEEGPELVVLPRGAKVLPADVTAQFLQHAVDAPGFKPIGGVIDTIVATVSSIVGTAAEILEEWLSKGAEWVVSQLSSFFTIDTSGWVGSIASALRERVLGWIRDFVSELLKKLEPKLDDKWYRPLDHYTITQEFGYTEYAKSGAYGGGPHTGIDLAAARGTPVYAARRGTVTFAGSSAGGYGNLIILAHKGDLTTYYAHLERILVSVGQQVAGKQQIGTVDSTGYSTGDHLHFEIREHGIPVDPRKYIAFGTGGLLREPVIGAGLLSGSRYLFAERGPEYVVPARDIAAAGTVGGGIDVDINFHGPVTINAHDEEQVNRVVHDIGYLIAQELRRRGLR